MIILLLEAFLIKYNDCYDSFFHRKRRKIAIEHLNTLYVLIKISYRFTNHSETDLNTIFVTIQYAV